MKKALHLTLLLTALLLAACTTDKNKEYINRFATAVANGDKATLAKMYPASEKADSLATIVADSAVIEPNQKGDTIKVKFGQNITLTMVKDANDSLQIVASRGLFAYPPERLAYAKSTGQFDDSLDDISNAERIADKGFDDFLTQILKSQLNGALKIVAKKGGDFAEGEGGFMQPMSMTATIENTSEITIPGSAYRVLITSTGWDWDRLMDITKTHPLPGKDINPGEKQSFKFKESFVPFKLDAKLQMLNTGDDLLSGYTPNGKEYEEYLKSKQ